MSKSKMKKLQELCHTIAVDKGFWGIVCPAYQSRGHIIKNCAICGGKKYYGKNRNNAELLMLMVSELGEACEGLRKDDWKNVAEELADTVIRVMDFCEARGIDLEKEILKKVEKNKKRKYRHGKKF